MITPESLESFLNSSGVRSAQKALDLEFQEVQERLEKNRKKHREILGMILNSFMSEDPKIDRAEIVVRYEEFYNDEGGYEKCTDFGFVFKTETGSEVDFAVPNLVQFRLRDLLCRCFTEADLEGEESKVFTFKKN